MASGNNVVDVKKHELDEDSPISPVRRGRQKLQPLMLVSNSM